MSGTSLSFAGPQFISFFAWPPSYHRMYVYCFFVIDVDHPTDLISIPYYKNATMVGFFMIYVLCLIELGQVYIAKKLYSLNESKLFIFVGDWFLLMQMAKHIRPNILHQLMLDLRDKFDKKRALHEDTD